LPLTGLYCLVGQLELESVDFDLHEVLSQCSKLLQSQTTEVIKPKCLYNLNTQNTCTTSHRFHQDVTLCVNVGHDVPLVVLGDANRLHQVQPAQAAFSTSMIGVIAMKESENNLKLDHRRRIDSESPSSPPNRYGHDLC
jgi:hypothetical protein